MAVSCTPASGSTFGLGTTVVSCSSTDAAGNTATGTFSVTVRDTTPPVVTVPADITAEATDAFGAEVVFAASATDLVDGAVAPICVPASGSVFPLDETTEVVCTATDAAGNSSSATFTVTVVDTTAPVLSGVPADMVLEAAGASGAVATWDDPTAFDLVDGDVAVTCEPASGSTFALDQVITVTCEAVDSHDNASSATFTVTVQDTTAPVLSVPAGVTATATSASGAVVTYTGTAQDLVDGQVVPVCTPASGSLFPLGATTVTCTATDAHGNASSASFQVIVTYAWSGVLSPIHQDGSSIFKAGSTVPVKFKLTGASAPITNATAYLFVTKFSNGVSGTEVEAVSTSNATTGNLFRYDATAGQYIFNLSTKGMTEGTWQLRIDLGDGVSRTVMISLKK